MRIQLLFKALPVMAAVIALCGQNANALGSHQPPPPPTPVAGTTNLTPAYCMFSSAAQDASEEFVTVVGNGGNNRHPNNLLGLQLTKPNNGGSLPYGLVTNTAHPTFATLDFDASGNVGNGSGATVVVVVSNTDGFLDEAACAFSDIKSNAANTPSTTPSGYNHYHGTNQNLENGGSTGFDQLATFVYADLGIVPFFNTNKQVVTMVNVQLNGGAFASGILATPSNNCQTFDF